jgi:hypothetical protein
MPTTTPFTGLRVWDQLLDDYDHDQLADNWFKMDMHDHTPGRGVQLTTQSIAPNSIAENQIIDEQVTTPKIAPEAVTPPKLEAALLAEIESLKHINEHITSFTAISGELVKCMTSGITVTSPPTVNGATFGVLASGHEVHVKPASGNILGAAAFGVAELTLSGYQQIILQSDGTNWYVISSAQLGVQQEPNTLTSVMSWGLVTENGTVLGGTGDYTVEKVTTGEYKVKWTTPKPFANYSVLVFQNVQVAGGGAEYYNISVPQTGASAKSTASFYIEFWKTFETKASPYGFSFLVLSNF